MSGIFTGGSTNGINYTTLWDKYIPVSKQNSLWYTGLCGSQMVIGADARNYMAPACVNQCAGPLGLVSYLDPNKASGIIDGTSQLSKTAQNWTFQWTVPDLPEDDPETAFLRMRQTIRTT